MISLPTHHGMMPQGVRPPRLLLPASSRMLSFAADGFVADVSQKKISEKFTRCFPDVKKMTSNVFSDVSDVSQTPAIS
jgi:hypothetical protein